MALCISMRHQECVFIGPPGPDQVVFKLGRVDGDRIQIVVDAPRHVPIIRAPVLAKQLLKLASDQQFNDETTVRTLATTRLPWFKLKSIIQGQQLADWSPEQEKLYKQLVNG